MDSNVKVKMSIQLPTYTAEESMVRTKLEVGMKLDDSDLEVIKSDLSNYLMEFKGECKTGLRTDAECEVKLRSYCKIKYPGYTLENVEEYL